MGTHAAPKEFFDDSAGDEFVTFAEYLGGGGSYVGTSGLGGYGFGQYYDDEILAAFTIRYQWVHMGSSSHPQDDDMDDD